MQGDWGAGNEVGALYVVAKNRLGNNDIQPKTGVLAVCTVHAGDCFYYYRLLEQCKNVFGEPTTYYSLGLRFGSYTLRESDMKLTNRQFHLLMAGDTIQLKG